MQLTQPMPGKTRYAQLVQHGMQLALRQVFRVHRFSRSSWKDPTCLVPESLLQVFHQNGTKWNDSFTGRVFWRIHFAVPDIASNRKILTIQINILRAQPHRFPHTQTCSNEQQKERETGLRELLQHLGDLLGSGQKHDCFGLACWETNTMGWIHIDITPVHSAS